LNGLIHEMRFCNNREDHINHIKGIAECLAKAQTGSSRGWKTGFSKLPLGLSAKATEPPARDAADDTGVVVFAICFPVMSYGSKEVC